MFTAWVMDLDGEVRKQFDDCMQVSVLSEEQMQIGYASNYVCLVDSQGPHFYPLYIYSVNIG